MRQGPGSFDPEYVVELDRANTHEMTAPEVRFCTVPASIRPSEALLAAQLRHRGNPETASNTEGVYDFTPVVLDNLEHLGSIFDLIGGDDTLSFAKILDSKGVRVVGIPKTMDNDVQGTEYCIGFSTAITRAKEAITRQRTTLGSHERIGVFRIFGRDAGFTALYTAYVTAGRCVIPEVKFDLDASSGS